MKRSGLGVSFFALALAASPLLAVAGPPAPVAPRGDVVDHVYGKDIPDPYRWMEGQDNKAFQEWLKAQGAVGRAWLDSAPTLAGWRTRLTVASAGSTTNRMQHRVAGRLFFLRLEQGKQGVLMQRKPDGSEMVLLDPNAVAATGGHASVTNYSVSADGRTIAVNVDHGGNEITTIEFYNTDTGARLPDQLDNIWGEFSVDWTPDGKAVTYTQMAPAGEQADQMLNMRARYHVMGTPVTQDKTLLVSGGNPTVPIAPQEFPGVGVSADSDWVIAVIGGARAQIRTCILPRAKLLEANAPWNCLINYDDEIQGANLKGNTFYAISKKDAPNGKLLTIDLAAAPTLDKARVLLPQSDVDVLTGTNVARDALYVRYMHNGEDVFVRSPYDGGPMKSVPLPYHGSAFLTDSDPTVDGLVFTLQSWTQPRKLFAYDVAKGLSDLNLGANSPKDYAAAIDILTVEAKSADGTLVPVTILQPKGYKPDGNALSLLDAYGGYGQATQPFFDPMTLEWVMAGHVYVFVSVRGGGEKGDAWRLAGKSALKYKGVEDLIGAADYMVSQGYSRKDHVGIYGASMGGLIMGGAVARYPDRFGAAIIHAGILNPTRLAAMPNGSNQFAETADPGTAEGFTILTNMDPYLAIKPGKTWPAVMLDVGLNDNRVTPWNSGKFGAALVAAGDTKVVYRTDADSGHFGTSLSQAAAEKADHYTFLEKAMGN
ncbi:prolyl oligopeptidase family serine peptidase [Asticcacaulis sp. 201]|uniref:prolyl oligopeptidase family serine peptidase n=1 Tax=Asticcacaulis sp. 201 TaxID=3028787 RepID=UPI002916B0C5|nr:prolyl oligopeptidase family serine peptidase [Asticcacaulis sp. 201]MDV6329360.1 prolyl oligopeptidase family serine peptidase [Asticcacaulis sp. 201]